MAPWVNEHLHLGVIETSSVEGFHAVLKQVLSVSPPNPPSLTSTFPAFFALVVPIMLA